MHNPRAVNNLAILEHRRDVRHHRGSSQLHEVLDGDLAVKAVPEARAASESPPEITLPWKSLPDSGSFMMRRVHLKTLRPSEAVPVLAPLARTPNAIMPVDASGELILRDYSSNIRRMLEVLEDLEKKSAR